MGTAAITAMTMTTKVTLNAKVTMTTKVTLNAKVTRIVVLTATEPRTEKSTPRTSSMWPKIPMEASMKEEKDTLEEGDRQKADTQAITEAPGNMADHDHVTVVRARSTELRTLDGMQSD